MGGDVVGVTGSATSPTATGFTCTGLTASAYIGHLVVLGATYGVITGNTATSVTVDKWYTPGDAVTTATTPGAGTYVILPGNAPTWYMALSNNSVAPAAGDTTLPGEVTTAGGGLVRKLATYGHTTGANSYTLTGAYTANASDTLPVTVYKIGTFNSLVSGQLLHETSLSASATLSASGDQLTVTQTVTT